jgi:hypothetical protein
MYGGYRNRFSMASRVIKFRLCQNSDITEYKNRHVSHLSGMDLQQELIKLLDLINYSDLALFIINYFSMFQNVNSVQMDLIKKNYSLCKHFCIYFKKIMLNFSSIDQFIHSLFSVTYPTNHPFFSILFSILRLVLVN